MNEAASSPSFDRRLVAIHSLGALAVLVLAYWLAIQRPVAFVYFTTEDHGSEYGTFAAWLIAAAVLAWGLTRFRALRTPGLIAYAAGAFFIAMEEISWGQRILGLETPEQLLEHNVQGELTLHNLVEPDWYFSFIGPAILAFGVGLPLLARAWPLVHRLAGKFGMPLAPPYLWPAFLATVYLQSGTKYVHRLPMAYELAELALAVTMMLLAVDVVQRAREGRSPSVARQVTATAASIACVALLAAPLTWFFPGETYLANGLYLAATKRFPRADLPGPALEILDHVERQEGGSSKDTVIPRGALLMWLGQEEEAELVLRGALDERREEAEDDPSDPEPLRRIGGILTLLGDDVGADEASSSALELATRKLTMSSDDLERAEALARLSLIHLQLGDAEAEARSLQEIEELGLPANDKNRILRWRSDRRVMLESLLDR